MERLQKLTAGYSSENIWNKNESGCFFKALLDEELVGKGKQLNGAKLMQRFTIAFFVKKLPGKKSKSHLLYEWNEPFVIRVECHVVLQD